MGEMKDKIDETVSGIRKKVVGKIKDYVDPDINEKGALKAVKKRKQTYEQIMNEAFKKGMKQS
jgi:hypothetical protein